DILLVYPTNHPVMSYQFWQSYVLDSSKRLSSNDNVTWFQQDKVLPYYQINFQFGE
ncbi:hypothetical protein ABEB36_009093, partial [Hypothenemus hampei]